MKYRLVACCAGLKGYVFCKNLTERGVRIDRLFAYPQSDDLAKSFERLFDLARERSIYFEEQRRPRFETDDLVLMVGWQQLVPTGVGSLVVFHDSVLPRYRGFAPTVTALIKGDVEIGVTAFQPIQAADEGAIIARASRPISYPIKIEKALSLQANLMSDLATRIVEQYRQGSVVFEAQVGASSYSIWRDEEDYEIDWFRPAAEIERFVNAVGYPYLGATTKIDRNEIVRVHEVASLSDLEFEIRQVGKVWRMDDGRPVVICGNGLIRIDHATNMDGSEYRFKRLRMRLGR